MFLTTVEKCKIVDQLAEEQPLLIKDTHNQIKKVEPHYNYLYTLTDVLKKFCQLRGLSYTNTNKHEIRGTHLNRNLIQERSHFIAVSLWLFSPSVYKIAIRTVEKKNVEKKELMPIYNAEDGIRKHLGGILGCNETWISQQVNPLAFNYHGRNKDFKELVDGLVAAIKEEVTEGYIEPEEVQEPLTMFQ